MHDDIIDNADSRWDIQTIHKREGLNQAILIGDYLFAKANEVAVSVNAELTHLIASTIVRLCEGQALELAAVYDTHRSVESYLQAIDGKTASLVSAACSAGAIATGATSKEVKALKQFGQAFGLSFQLLDDVLDLVSSPELLGKPTASDIREGVYTLAVLLALQGQDSKEFKTLLKAAEAGPLNHAAYTHLKQPLLATIEQIKAYNHQAQQFLAVSHAELAGLPEKYTDWALSNLVTEEHAKYLGLR